MRRTRLFLMTTGLSLALVRAPAADAPQNPAPKTSQPATQKLRNPLNDLLDEAQAALDKNDYEAAIPPLQKFIAEKPDVAFAHFQLAYAYTALKRPDDARQEYERSIALDPKIPEAQLNLGVLLLERQPAAAVAVLRRAVELLPSESRPRYLLGLAQERSGDFSGAAESFAGATRLDPKELDSLTRLGQVLLRLGKSADAEGKFRAALELQPNSPEALQGLAQSLDQQKKPQAVDAYRNYLAAEPDDKAARLRLVHLLVEQQKYDEAVAENAKDNAGQPATVDDLKLRADIEINQKKLDEAITTLRRAIALAPNDAQLHGGLAQA